MTRIILRYSVVCLLIVAAGNEAGAQLFRAGEERLAARAESRIGDISAFFEGWHHVGDIRIDSLEVNRDANILFLYFSTPLTHIPVRHTWIGDLRSVLAGRLGFRFRDYHIRFYSGGREVEEYIPNFFRDPDFEADQERVFRQDTLRRLVRKAHRPDYPGGLSGTHLAVWPSHGYHYSAERDRWEWQRARLYGTVEDLYPFSFVQPWLVPMLENAGAYVFLPRERDIQVNEVIVTAHGSTGSSGILMAGGEENPWAIVAGRGFAIRDTLFDGDNPFLMGSHFRIRAEAHTDAELRFLPEIPESGEYAVYVSWVDIPENIPGVSYTVNYSGGMQEFIVDQTMGAGTWIYLGTFHFFSGMNEETGSVVVSGSSSIEGYITAGAVRFGGGMGNVARKPDGGFTPQQWSLHDGVTPDPEAQPLSFWKEPGWKLSGRPRYMEGARYFLQYSGMPDSTVYSLTGGKNDYNDDFMSRGEWVNFLSGAPMEVTGAPAPGNPGVPLDLSLAFHTDAGVTANDSVIGTLAIYSTQGPGDTWFNGVSRLGSRDLSDIVQTQITHDLRFLVNGNWTRRGLWDRRYSEAWRPQVPAMLLELLSHQNLADMSYGLDPRFKFIVSRSIYKGILRYLASGQGREVVVQPLPPSGMALEKTGTGMVRLSWKGTHDPLEPSAAPEGYRVYTRRENAGFDHGISTTSPYLDFHIEKGIIYGFKVTALNRGGESMPGEILSVLLGLRNEKPILIVNGFTRISGPPVFDLDGMAGIKWWEDPGVPCRYDFSHTGVQYDFDRMSPWLDDDSPGWGASYADMEGKIVFGNTFDYPYIYGLSLREAGYSFVSVSREAFERNTPDPENHQAVIVGFGEQRGVPSWKNPTDLHFRVFSAEMINALRIFADSEVGIMVSGSYLGTDMVENSDSAAISFARDYLGFSWRTNHATNNCGVKATGQAPPYFPDSLCFNVSYDPPVYRVAAPDAIEAAGDDAATVYRYSSNGTSAGVLKNGRNRVVALGFPFETLCCLQRTALLGRIMEFLTY